MTRLPMDTDFRDYLGRLVRETWIKWARTQYLAKSPHWKPSWEVEWGQLDESDKEVDRMIGERLYREGYNDGREDGHDE